MKQDKVAVNESILEIQVEASLGGHDLSTFELVTNRLSGGYETHCRNCGQTAWVGENGIMYSLLGSQCITQSKTK